MTSKPAADLKFRELDIVSLKGGTTTDDGIALAASDQGTIVSLRDGDTHAIVEFSNEAHPFGGLLATVPLSEMTLVWRAGETPS